MINSSIVLKISSSAVELTVLKRDTASHRWHASMGAIALTCGCALVTVGWQKYQRYKADTFNNVCGNTKDDKECHTSTDSTPTTIISETKSKNIESTATKSTAPKSSSRPTLGDSMKDTNGSTNIRPIGYIRSVYQLCVGTPRQGLLAPHARGRIELNTTFDLDSVQELERFSHIWVLFLFHLNTVGKRKAPSKIAPPALGGKKVGVFATRSPHRFNPIGISLVKLDSIKIVQICEHGKRSVRVVHLNISGLDLVDRTPVIDIKPYVSVYDAPPEQCMTPSWVSEGLNISRHVEISADARNELRNIIAESPSALQFYHGDTAESDILAGIQEILSMDVRSPFQTEKARQGKFQAEKATRLALGPTTTTENSEETTQQFDRLLIRFKVTKSMDAQRVESLGSGAEDYVTVTAISLL
jgi:tRNA (adenine37-N6)-methyltransferase